MRRRSWLNLGLAAGAVLALGGGAVALIEPGWQSGRLTSVGRRVLTHAARGLLDGILPQDAVERERALDAFVGRTETLVAALPPHAQRELSQLLALLATGAGRQALAGLKPDWAQASVPEIRQALQTMRLSTATLRQQSYQALHDITGAAYFSDTGTWRMLGYPGPQAV